jgi:hypothetical protein
MAENNPTGDRFVEESEEQETGIRDAEAANLFDLRRIIGGLFLVYGVLMTILGITDSQQEIDRAAGVNINLWAGLGMLAMAAFFIVWALARPLSRQLEEAEQGG